jgi:hypothetical protein
VIKGSSFKIKVVILCVTLLFSGISVARKWENGEMGKWERE